MTSLKYTTNVQDGKLYIKFKEPVSARYRSKLKDLGFDYIRSKRCWCGTQHCVEAIQLVKDAYGYSQNPSSNSTLCWKCDHSDKGNISFCPWVNRFKPVDGWEAEPSYDKKSSYLKGATAVEPFSYTVINCPMFTTDAKSLYEDVEGK